YPVASIAAAAISYGLADVLSGSGFLAVYLTGLVLGSARIPARRTVDDFHAGLAWVSQIALFLTLGLLVFPSDLDRVAVDRLARALGLTSTEPALPRPLVEVGAIQRLGAEVLEFPIVADDAIVGHVVNELDLPREALVSVIVRRDEALLPRGSTELEAGDRL